MYMKTTASRPLNLAAIFIFVTILLGGCGNVLADGAKAIQEEAVSPKLALSYGPIAIKNDGTFDLGFGSVLEPVYCTLTLSNNGKTPLLLDLAHINIAMIGGIPATVFTIDNLADLPASIQPGQAASLIMKFSADSTGEKSAVVSIPSNDVDQRTFSFTVTGEGIETPNAPVSTSIIVTPGSGQAVVEWGSTIGATSYNLYWSTSPSVTKATGTKIAGEHSPYPLTGLSDNQTYYFIVTSVGAGGESPDSFPAKSALTYPASAVLTGAEPAGPGQVALSWTPPAGGAASYNIWYSSSSGAETKQLSGVTGSSTVVSGLTNWSPYYFKVEAANASGTAALSGEKSCTPVREEILIVNSLSHTLDYDVVNTHDWTVSRPGAGYATVGDAYSLTYSVAISPNLAHVFIADRYPSWGIGDWNFNKSTGVCGSYKTFLNTIPGAAVEHVVSVTTPSDVKMLYAAYSNNVYIAAIKLADDGSVESATPADDPGAYSRYVTANSPTQAKWLYASNSLANSVTLYSINSATGALVNSGTYATGNYPFRSAVDPSGEHFYVVNFADNTVSAFSINSSTGALTSVAGSPFATGGGPTSVAIDPAGAYAYVTNSASNTVTAYAIDTGTGALSPIGGTVANSSYATGAYPNMAAVNSTGAYLVVANSNSNNATVYSVNASTGALVNKFSFITGVSPSHLIIVKLP